MKIILCIRYGFDGQVAEIEAFSSRELAAAFIDGHGGDWECRSAKVDGKAHWTTRQFWWCRVNKRTGKEVKSGKRPWYDFAPDGETHTIKHGKHCIEVRSFVSQDHADDLARTEVAGVRMQ